MCLGWEPDYLHKKPRRHIEVIETQEVQNREVIAVRDTAILVFVFKHVSCEIHMN